MTVPNAITVLRLLLVIPIAVLLVQNSLPELTLVLLIVFGVSDWVDGFLARRLGQTSHVGAILDPIADRIGVAVIALAFVAGGHLPASIAVVVAAVDVTLGVAYLVLRSARSPTVSMLGKVRTAVLMTGLALVGLGILPTLETVGLVGIVVCGVGAVLHVVSGAGYLRALTKS